MQRLFQYTIFFLIIIFITALLTEAGLGIAFHFKDRDLEPMPVHDYPYLYYLFDSGKGLNEHGLKTQYPIKKSPGKYRIILTGGSVARGKQPEQSIAHHLEKELNKQLKSDRVEVINAGMSAYVAQQEFLLIQLFLQHYEPNLFVSLTGYNDLITTQINRLHPAPFELPPHHWNDFKVIESNRQKKQFWSRFSQTFRNIHRATSYLKRKRLEEKSAMKGFSEEEFNSANNRFRQIITDTRDFSKAKKISYFAFLQPLRFYPDCTIPDSDKPLCTLYEMMNQTFRELPFTYPLTDLLRHRQELFTDDCHVLPEGNRMIATAIAERICDDVQMWMEN